MDAEPLKILVIDPNAQRAGAMSEALQSAGMEVRIDLEAGAPLEAARSLGTHCVLAHWPESDEEGRALCEQLQRARPLALVATVDQADHGAVAVALESGVDDCVTASVQARELIARVRAAVRRCARPGLRSDGTLRVGALTLDAGSHQVRIEGRQPNLTQYEFGLLKALAEEAGRVLSREELMERVKGSLDASFDRSIDVHMCRLRFKLGDDSRSQRILKTVRGAGYMLVEPQP